MHEEAHLQLEFARDMQHEGGRKTRAEIAQEWGGYAAWNHARKKKRWAGLLGSMAVLPLACLGLAVLGPKGKCPNGPCELIKRAYKTN